jgi:hypothetical protein
MKGASSPGWAWHPTRRGRAAALSYCTAALFAKLRCRYAQRGVHPAELSVLAAEPGVERRLVRFVHERDGGRDIAHEANRRRPYLFDSAVPRRAIGTVADEGRAARARVGRPVPEGEVDDGIRRGLRDRGWGEGVPPPGHGFVLPGSGYQANIIAPAARRARPR